MILKEERNEIAFAVVKILLPEVQKTIKPKSVTYDSIVRDSFYIADLFMEESKQVKGC